MTAATGTVSRGHWMTRFRAAWLRLYRGETKFDFVRRRRIWFAISGIIILAGVVSLAVRGLNLSIEFVGGTSWEVQTSSVTVDQAKAALTPYGLGGATITVLAGGGHRTIEVSAKLPKGQTQIADQDKVSAALAKLAGTSVNDVTVEQVGPSWGSEITHKAVEALIVFFVLISAYISIFFEWKMAAAAIIAVIHDIAVTVGIYSLAWFLVTPDTVVAFLTILGYSLYDTIVVFDRVKDNTRGLGATGRMSYTDVVNLSMNQTLARSINTSLVAILPILSVLVLGANVLGAVTLEYFGLALLIGLTSGAYSSIFIASPLLAMFKERETRYTAIRERLESRGTTQLLLTPLAYAQGALAADDGTKVRSRRAKSTQGQASQARLQPGASRATKARGAVATQPAGAAEEVATDGEQEMTEASSANGSGPSAKQTSTGGNGSRPGGAAGRSGSGGGAKKPPPRPRKKKRR